MLYDESLQATIVDTLNNRVSTIVDCIIALLREGYLPNKNKITVLDWGSIMIHAFQNIEVFNEEQQNNLENLFNKIIRL